MIDLSVIIPCFNEEGNIRNIVYKIRNLFDTNHISGEIILVNDGSNDTTQSVIEKCAHDFENVVGVHHQRNSGIAESWHSGLENSHGKYVATIDADMQYNPSDIAVLYNLISNDNYDIVQGWRKDYKDNKIMRKLYSKGLSYLLVILFLTKMPDLKSGLVIYKRQIFFDVLQERTKFFAYHHFCIICALSKGYTLKQIPITFSTRQEGRSFMKHPFFFACRSLLDMPRAVKDFGIFARNKKNH